VLRAALGDDRPFAVSAEAIEAEYTAAPGMRGHAGMMRGDMPAAGLHAFMPAGVRFAVQVRLNDGSWAAFDTRIPRDAANLPLRLVLTLLILLAVVAVMSLVAVRWVTRPLNVLASAAEALGRDIHRAPLPEHGPTEVRRAAHAFNDMQTRLVRFIDERTRVLTAMSHDLKTPITRMRLRAELLEDEEQRLRFEKDLKEMEAMVAQTLDFMRGLGSEARQPIDLMALVESLQADHAEMGRTVTIEGRAATPLIGMPLALKRCLANLLDNAALYGSAAHVVIEDGASAVTLRIRDDGPGIPEAELEKVFEPFHRLEASRNRATGGTGLGLGIAREIARAHGGDLVLHNHSAGGLEAVLTLPRR
jgi:signal transduction histidine kinase